MYYFTMKQLSNDGTVSKERNFVGLPQRHRRSSMYWFVVVQMMVACLLLLQCASAYSFVPPTARFARRAFVPKLAVSLKDDVELDMVPQEVLSSVFSKFASSLDRLGLSTPTPIQAASSKQALAGDNVLLIAPTGSGKTLAYLLPALTDALTNDATLVVVAPTRELAVQLTRDAESLLEGVLAEKDAEEAVQVAVRGVPPPLAASMKRARVLIGTPPEVLTVVSSASREFVARIGAIVLDEVDVLLPNQPKSMRTALDEKKGGSKLTGNSGQDERRKREQKRKRLALRRRADTDSATGAVISPTERILLQVAGSNPQILAGSATASRRTLDTLNRVVRKTRDGLTAAYNDVVAVRPAVSESTDDSVDNTTVNTDRSITVPSEVTHRYILLTKEEAASPGAVLKEVAKTAKLLKPKSALLFLCGDFGRPKTNAKSQTPTLSKKGKTAEARRNNARRAKAAAKQITAVQKTAPPTISARQVCTNLRDYGIVAQPLHVALGLEPNASIDSNTDKSMDGTNSNEQLPFFVTFEGSARGLHFDAVDCVFVIGRPASSSSYLHLAGRVGRASADENGEIVNVPGTVVSFCTKGQATELEKWSKQIGGTDVAELEHSEQASSSSRNPAQSISAPSV